MRFQRRGGRKRIVTPDGSAIVPNSKPQPDATLVKALARAWRWQRMLDDGVYRSVSKIGDAENISKSYVTRILRLALLAPDITEAILGGMADQLLLLERLERPLPASWEEQRVCILEPNGNAAASELRFYRRAADRDSSTATPPSRHGVPLHMIPIAANW
jgi:hypothetical protein